MTTELADPQGPLGALRQLRQAAGPGFRARRKDRRRGAGRGDPFAPLCRRLDLDLLKTAFRAKNKIPVMSFYQTAGVSLRCDEPMNTQIDGDPTGQVNELQVSVNPSALRLRTP